MNALIRLRRCAGRSALLLFACNKIRFSSNETLMRCLIRKHNLVLPNQERRKSACAHAQFLFFLFWFDAQRPSQQLWSLQDGQFT